MLFLITNNLKCLCFFTGTADHDVQGIAEQNAKSYYIGVRLFPAKLTFTVIMWKKIRFNGEGKGRVFFVLFFFWILFLWDFFFSFKPAGVLSFSSVLSNFML